MSDELAEQVTGVGALAEPARRALYLYVAAQPGPVSREQAAKALEVPLHSAKFHLDRLVAEGLLEVEFRRLSGRSGPGAGRPSKLYRRSSRQFSVTLPERRYDLVGELMATAIDRALEDEVPIAEAVRDAAQGAGTRIAAERPDAADDRSALTELLARHGYEPRVCDGEILLANCPFDRLAGEHTELVCGMNLTMLSAVVDQLGVPGVRAELAPQPGLCCVRMRS